MNDEYALVMDIEHELMPIIDFLEVYTIDGELQSIGLKTGISFKQFSNFYPDITKKELVKLLDWFNDNLEATQEVIEKIKELV